jgi:hypothetical protein
MAGSLGSAVAWLIALSGLISTISAVPELGLYGTLGLAMLCANLPAALSMTRHTVAARHRAVRRRARGGTP